MELSILNTSRDEICHYASSELLITSLYNKITIKDLINNKQYLVKLPREGWKHSFGLFRICRRLFRLDKSNVQPVSDGLIIIYQRHCYHYCFRSQKLTKTLVLKNCKTILHQAFAVIDDKTLFFGEYGTNSERNEIPIYRTDDAGKSWQIAYVLPPGKARHVHSCCYDSFENKLWVFTGDFEHECHIMCCDIDFKHVEWIGDGSQAYRACGAFFEEDAVHWIMDSPIEESHHFKMARSTRKIEKKSSFNGPVIYIKRLTDGYFLAATSVETGPGVKDKFSHLMVSKDLETWEDIFQFEHDGLPLLYFKYGVIGFAEGKQSSENFYLFAEALKKYDGKTLQCSLTKDR